MTAHSSAIHLIPSAVSSRGLAWATLGVVAFSFTVPLTRVAVGGMSPLFVGAGRAVIAAVLAATALALFDRRRPRGMQWLRLGVVAAGVVLGFPVLTSFALTSAPASHGAVVIALLPAVTATMAVLRGRERPRRSFWILAAVGAGAAIIFASLQGGGLAGPTPSDLLLFAAVVAGAVGYAEGGLLARELGSWQTISWALVLASPVTVALTISAAAQQFPRASGIEWAAFGYLAAVSMFLGFFAWYRGLAIGPMAQVSQVQLGQPVLSILWAALLLHEEVSPATLLGGVAVILCAGMSVRARSTPAITPQNSGGTRRVRGRA